MTTVAYKDGVVAYDGRQTRGDTIVDDATQKLFLVNDHKIIGVGCVSGVQRLIVAYFGGEPKPPMEANLMVVTPDKILKHVGFDDADDAGDLWTTDLSKEAPHAFGSGAMHALTAMDMGATAKEAVKMAMKRDIFTGGKIRSFKI